MAYEFPIVTAIQCIPEFYGSSEELEPFLLMTQYFASKIPEGEDETPLLNVVYVKLKGDALLRFRFIKDVSWAKVEQKLKNEFQYTKRFGELMNDIETLVQGPSESFKQYKRRAEDLLYWIHELMGNGGSKYADAQLKLHFLAGLRGKEIKLTGISRREKSFLELVEWLQMEYEEEKDNEKLSSRLPSARSPQSTYINQNFNNGRNQLSWNQKYNKHHNKRTSRFGNLNMTFQQNDKHSHKNDSFVNFGLKRQGQKSKEHQGNYGNIRRQGDFEREFHEKDNLRNIKKIENNYHGYNYNGRTNNNFECKNNNRYKSNNNAFSTHFEFDENKQNQERKRNFEEAFAVNNHLRNCIIQEGYHPRDKFTCTSDYDSDGSNECASTTLLKEENVRQKRSTQLYSPDHRYCGELYKNDYVFVQS